MGNVIEEWRDVVGYEGWYKISNKGRLKRIKKGRGTRPKNILTPKKHKAGYHVYNLCYKCNQKDYLAHRLVAIVFIPNPENKPEVNHKNGIKDDNRVENLEWCTHKENIRHAINALGSHGENVARGEKHPRTAFTNSDVREIKRLLRETNLNQQE